MQIHSGNLCSMSFCFHCSILSVKDFCISFKNIFSFNWKRIALQYCVGFCHISTWISHRHTYAPSLSNLLLTSHPTPPHPSRSSQSTGFELPESHSKLPLAIYFTYGNIYVSMLLFQFVPSSPSPNCFHKSVLHVCISKPFCKQDHQYHLSRFHIYVLIYICFSLSGLLHSVQ